MQYENRGPQSETERDLCSSDSKPGTRQVEKCRNNACPPPNVCSVLRPRPSGVRLALDLRIELDDLLDAQISVLKGEREKAKTALDRARSQGAGAVTIDAEKVEAF